MATTITKDQVDAWVTGYQRAWNSASPQDLEVIYAENANSHEHPYATSRLGIEQIKSPVCLDM